MNYMNGLKELRLKLVESATGRQVPQTETLETFIPARATSQPQPEATEDLMTKGANWISEIKKASIEFKKAYEAAKAKEQTPSAAKAFAENFAEGVVRPKQRPEEVEREAILRPLVERRGESSPSLYAPRRPSEVTSFKEAIDLTEGGGDYDTLFGFSNRDGKYFEGFRVSDMTIGEIKAFADPNGEYGQWVKGQIGRVATPMGRYQFVGTTLKSLAEEMGLDDNTVFSPDVQDQMFDYYLGKRIAKGKTIDEKVSQVRAAWEGFKSIPTPTLKSLIMQYEAT